MSVRLPTFARKLFKLTTATLIALITLPTLTLAQGSDAKWDPLKSQANSRTLQYSASASLLGKPSAVSLKFYCDTTSTKTQTGALGFDLVIAKVADLAPFGFEAFEGPDAPAAKRKLLRATVTRPGKPPLVLNIAPAGWSPDGPNFAFGVSAPSQQAGRNARTLLRALADGAETLSISITDAKNPKLKLELSIPVADKAADFKALIAGLK